MELPRRAGTNLARPSQPELLTVAAAAVEAKVPAPTLYRWMREGRLTKYEKPVGQSRVFVDRRELRQLLQPAKAQPKPRGRR